ncbi:hypothetical protein MFLAVUS_005502 [Mucor flavus]|uniref:Uncharacterized protein n=1 Tax=Mucor flavus TaxID=439312 RepID=A0ABP9YYY0_9FUNG
MPNLRFGISSLQILRKQTLLDPKTPNKSQPLQMVSNMKVITKYNDDVIMEDSTMKDDVKVAEDDFGTDSEVKFDSDSGSEYSELGSYTFTFSAKPFFSFKKEFDTPALLFFKSGQDNYSLIPYNVKHSRN